MVKETVAEDSDGLPVDPPNPDEEPEVFVGEDERFRSLHEDRLRQASVIFKALSFENCKVVLQINNR